jgi:1-deoxy-D-xylulose-5-phosphate synthase
LGKSETLVQGTEIAIIALGERVTTAMEIREILPQFSFTIINARFVKPLDEEMLLNCARHHHHIYTMEDHVRSGGFGSAVMEFLSDKNLSAKVHIFAWPDKFIPHGSRVEDLEKMFHFTVEDMAAKIKSDQESSVEN